MSNGLGIASDSYAIGVDIGGTFTDGCLLTGEGESVSAKVPTNPRNRAESFFEVIDALAGGVGVDGNHLLAHCGRLVHGTTTGTNAIVARQGALVGLITTAGHRDIMYLMKGGGRTVGLPPDDLLFIAGTDKPKPLVKRDLVMEAVERIDVDGDVIVPLDKARAKESIVELAEAGVEAFAISLLWSVQNPEHEDSLKSLINDMSPGAFVSCGAELSSRLGEYERTVTAVFNAYVGPLMVGYVSDIEKGAIDRGYKRDVLFTQCAGGAIGADEAQRAPVRTVQSGPVSGVVGSAFLAERLEYRNVITTDMGGTTFDVSVIRDGRPLSREISEVERFELALPMLDVESIGAGGGSIASIDELRRLRVGPHSAGADPGPACYMRGGTEPTVTDADVVLGMINPDTFLGGRMKLSLSAAQEAILRVAEQLNMELHEAAAGINQIVDSKMSDLIRRMSVLRGFEIQDFVCFAFGGGGPLHAGSVAQDIGLKKIIVPLFNVAPVWSALGAAAADVSHVYQLPRIMDMPADAKELNVSFGELESQATEVLKGEGFADESIQLLRSVRMKHKAQIHDVEVPVSGEILDEKSVKVIDEDFDHIYAAHYGQGAGFRQAGVQITSFQVKAFGLTSKPQLGTASIAESADVVRLERPVYWYEEGKFVDTPVLQMDSGRLEEEFQGPILFELPHTVVVVRPGQVARFDSLGNVIIELP